MMTSSRSPVTATPAAPAAEAAAHFSRRLELETDADDVAAAIRDGDVDFTLVDVRSPAAYAAAHLPGAVPLPHASIDAMTVDRLPAGLLVVYCWGPGCNGAQRGAAKLAALGRQVKEMLGGFEYYVREGHPVEGDAVSSGIYRADERGLVAVPSAVSCGC